jgi:predicted patatin/cPLA2 family phospholipase
MNRTFYGVNPTVTIDLLEERVWRAKHGRPWVDGRKIGLIVEGGAMRGVISCAALMGLEELGMTEVFDEVYGASAGAVNAAYFLAGQAAYATTLYYQKINNTRFIRRFWHRKIVDIDDLFDSIIAGQYALRVDKVLASRSQLFITIADAFTGEAFLGHAQTNQTPLLTLLKASTAMPLLYNGIVTVDGRNCFDGGLINPLPILEAIESGCTDLLVLLTRPASFRDCLPGRLERHIFDLRCAHGNEQLMNAFCNTYIRENAVRDIALGRQPVPDGITIATLCPDENEPKIERTTRDAQLLKPAAIASARRTLAAFGHVVEDFVEVLRPFPAIAREIAAEIEGVDSEPDDSTLAAA